MRLLIFDHLANAIDSLRASQSRTILTSLGVTIGVASVTAIFALGAGISHTLSSQVESMKDDLAIVRPAQPVSSEGIPLSQSIGSSSLTIADYKASSRVDGVNLSAPLMTLSGTSRAKGGDSTATTIVASTPALEKLANLEVRDGQFIDNITDQQTAVLGQQTSISLFGTDQSIGKTFTVRGQRFTVIGILKPTNDPINFNGIDFDHTAIIHLEAGSALNNDTQAIQQINLQVEQSSQLPAITKHIEQQLTELHYGEQDFQIISGKAIAQPTSQIYRLVQSVVVAVAAISLVVGGIGVMNIMLVNVSERTREIGLRKAIGATNGHILMQFLVESILIGLVGGLAGYIFGYLAAFTISTFLPIVPVFTWEIVGLAAAMSLIVGVVFGLYPAMKAARKDPIESLRYYH